MDILWSVVILATMGLVFGFGLAVAAKKLYVKSDTRIQDISEMLPKANCGGCGFPGCNGFAEAIVNGKVERLSQCKPGKPDKNFNQILQYLEEHPNEDGTKIAVKI